MEILLVARSGIDAVGSFTNDLTNLFVSRNHNVWFHGINPFITFGTNIHEEQTIIPGKYGLAYINYFKPFPQLNCSKIYHAHLAEIKNAYKDNIFDVIKNESNFKIAINNQFQKQQLLSLGVNLSLLNDVPNHVDETRYKILPAIEKIPNSIILLSNISNKTKSIWIPMLKAMKRLPEYRLNIVGQIADNVKIRFLDYVNKARNSNINHYGAIVDPIKKVRAINRHEIGIGIGRSAREMVLCGLPVLVYREGFAGYLTSTNADDLIKDNITTRWKVEVEESDKVTKIVQAIRNPETYDNTQAISKFGMRANISIYQTLMGA